MLPHYTTLQADFGSVFVNCVMSLHWTIAGLLPPLEERKPPRWYTRVLRGPAGSRSAADIVAQVNFVRTTGLITEGCLG